MQGPLAVKLGDPLAVYWFIPTYTISIAVGFLIAGANSDLFGRRLTLLVGEAGVIVGMILLASAKGTKQFQAGLGLSGFFGGLCQMALVSIP
jgi:MFS family permease